MLEFKTGNIFDTTCETIVNTVNCVGVMGKGIALECKKRYPDMYAEYTKRCGHTLSEGGDLWFWENPDCSNFVSNNLFAYETPRKHHNILCFATKEHWKNNSQLVWIERGLKKFAQERITVINRITGEVKLEYFWKLWNIHSIAFPKLGCTNGQLKWEDVKPLIIKYLKDLPIKIEIYE
jgi:hypothetical protein